MDKLDTTWVIRTASKTAEYTGEVAEDGEITGHGLYMNAEGDLYSGDFKSNRFSGAGAYRFADSSVFNGEFVDGKYHGNGCFRASDGSYYEGQWKDGMRHGAGTLMFVANKMRILFEGEWKKDMMEGTFKETRHYPQNKAVRVWTCAFSANKLVSRKLLSGPVPDDNPPAAQTAQVDPTKWAARAPNELTGIFRAEEEKIEVLLRPRRQLVPLALARDSNASSASSSSASGRDSASSSCSSPGESLVAVRPARRPRRGPRGGRRRCATRSWRRCCRAARAPARSTASTRRAGPPAPRGRPDGGQFLDGVVECHNELLKVGSICSEECLVARLRDWDKEGKGKRNITNQKVAAGYVTALVERHIIGPFPTVAAKRPRTRRSKLLCAVCGK